MAASSSSSSSTGLGRQRLMRDIKELIERPYPNIAFSLCGTDMSSACLVLSPEGYKPLHITVTFGRDYPLDPPTMRMDTDINHPNIYGSYICATILRRTDEYTPAYTLKAIAIQMLSFFGSDSVEQEHGGNSVSLSNYRMNLTGRNHHIAVSPSFACDHCHYNSAPQSSPYLPPGANYVNPKEARNGKKRSRRNRNKDDVDSVMDDLSEIGSDSTMESPGEMYIDQMPDEVLLLMLEELDDFEHLTRLARAWPRVSRLIVDYDLLRRRELQCFCLKKTYREVKLGVGVSIDRRGQVASEFDLLSEQGFEDLSIRQSVHNINFSYWLPLPISWRHWEQVRGKVDDPLRWIKGVIRGAEKAPNYQVLYNFMNDIVVRLNDVADQSSGQWNEKKSSLRHASEKAIESYFHLFHLLVCMACDTPGIVRAANALLLSFGKGARTKTDCPNLGHLLVALLISDVDVTDDLRKAIITEAITRNVVWLLDGKGANMAELAYLEPSAVSAYRLDRTFRGSRTSYRLLMFSELFRRTARPEVVGEDGVAKKMSLFRLRDELFDRHGAPPRGAAAHLASEVRRLHTVEDFPAFMREMGVKNIPSAENFTAVLRQTMTESVRRGYSRWGLPQNKALVLRQRLDPLVDVAGGPDMRAWAMDHQDDRVHVPQGLFFPEKRQDNGGGRGGGGRGGRRAGGRHGNLQRGRR